MKILKTTQLKTEINPQKKGLRLTALKREEIASKLQELVTDFKVDHKITDMQVVFTGDKKETLIVLNAGE